VTPDPRPTPLDRILISAAAKARAAGDHRSADWFERLLKGERAEGGGPGAAPSGGENSR
jgi:hypothetical protein